MTEGRGGALGKAELARAKGVEGRSAVNGPQVRSEDVAMSDPGGANVLRETDEGLMVHTRVEGGRSVGVGVWRAGRGGPACSKAKGGAPCSWWRRFPDGPRCCHATERR